MKPYIFKILLSLSVTSILAFSGCGSSFDSGDKSLFRLIDNVMHCTRISTAADDVLNKIYVTNEAVPRLRHSKNAKLGITSMNGKSFITLASTQIDHEAMISMHNFAGNEIDFDLLFGFDKSGLQHHRHSFGFYFLKNTGMNQLLGCSFSYKETDNLTFEFVVLDLGRDIYGSFASRVIDSRSLDLTYDEMNRVQFSINVKGITLDFSNAKTIFIPFPAALTDTRLLFYPFAINSSAKFRLENINQPGSKSGSLETNIKNIINTNLYNYRDLYANKDIPLPPQYQGYVYKLPIGLDYRNAFAGFTPFSTEFNISSKKSPASLRFGYGILDESWSSGIPVTFKVILKNKNGSSVIFEKTLMPDEIQEHNAWFDEVLDVSDIPGGFDRIELRAEHAEDSGIPAFIAWANPELYFKRNDKAPPNFLLITLDTVRWDRLSCMGYFRNTTPNIDAVAAEGFLFEQCITQAPWTTPSHFSILTSLYPSQHGVMYDIRYDVLRPEICTITELLRKHAYHNAAIVFNAPVMQGKLGFNQGFDKYEHIAGPNVFFAPHDIEELSGKAGAWLRKNGTAGPFFLFLHVYETHRPFTNNFYAGDSVNWQNDGQYKKFFSDLYDGDLHFTDEHLKKVFGTLDELGLRDNTVLIITSDHGYVMPGEKGNYEDYVNNLYEGTVRVPLVIRCPSGIAPAAVIPDQVRLIDIPPTMLDIAGFDAFPEFEGKSLLPLIQGKQIEPLTAYAEAINTGPERKMIRTELYKYIFIPEMIKEKIQTLTQQGMRVNKRELFNLKEDPWEQHNIAEREEENTKIFQGKIDEFILAASSDSSGTSKAINFSESELQNLRGLGYIK